MKKSLRSYWLDSLEVIAAKPVILFPFVILAFIEGIALELLYFFPKKPISYVISPIVAKFFGESYLHYPANLLLLPSLFYFVQLFLYVVVGYFLFSVSIHLFKHAKSDLPLKTDTIMKNAFKRYPTMFVYGILMVALISLTKKVDTMILARFLKWAMNYAPNTTPKIFPAISALSATFSYVVLQVFFILVIPIIVLKKKSLLKAVLENLYLGVRHFFSLFILILLPFMVYLPITLVRSYMLKLSNMTFPEIALYIEFIGIAMAIFIDCYVMIIMAHFYMAVGKKR